MKSIRQTVAGYLPAPIRSALRRTFFPAVSDRPPIDLFRFRAPKPFVGRHVVVAGLFRSGTGLGRAADLVARTLRSRGATVTLVDLTERLGISMPEQGSFVQPSECRDASVTDVVVVVNPDYHYVLRFFDLKWLLGRCVIGHWIWELERVPPDWAKKTSSFDLIWAPTELIAQSLRECIPPAAGRVGVLPYAIDEDPMPAVSATMRVAARRKHGIDENAVVLGYAFACGSNYYRKNPEAAIDAFKKLFETDAKPAVLVLRSNDLLEFPAEYSRLLQSIGEDKRIRVFGPEARLGLRDFYALLDLLISPSRAEGFGLTLVEAAQAGIPVVTTGWRLPAEMDRFPLIHQVGYDLVPVVEAQGHYRSVGDCVWAEPRVDEMVAIAAKLTRLHG